MASVARTRTSLLQLKRKIQVAERGLALLRSKREALIREFFGMMNRVVESRGQLDAAVARALHALALAAGMEGQSALRSAGYASQRHLPVELTERNVWGVRFPELQYPAVVRALDNRGYAPTGTSTHIDETARRFESLLELILQSVAVEMRLKKLGAEIKKATRRSNALTEVMIPVLRHQLRETRQALEEREREDLFRMKRFKRRTEAPP